MESIPLKLKTSNRIKTSISLADVKKLLFSFFLVGLMTLAKADTNSSNIEGVIILTSASGLDPRNVLFSDLIWTDFDGGTVIDSNGQKSVFAKKDIGKIIYFDSHYYYQLNNNQQEAVYREGIQAREVVVNTAFLNLDAINDLKSLQDSQSTLESIARVYPPTQSLIQPQIDLLKDDITKLSSGQSLVDGKWMSKEEANTQKTPVIGENDKPVTFSTKDGKKYINAKVSITDTGLSVLTSDGGASVPFDQLPDDLSAFPQKLQAQIAANRQITVAANTPAGQPSQQDTAKPAPSGNTQNQSHDQSAVPNESPQVSNSLNQASEFDPQRALVFYKMGKEAMKRGDLDNAMWNFNKALSIDSKKTDIYITRALCEALAKSFDDANADIKKASEINPALTINPDSAPAYCGLGFLKSSQKDFSGAVDAFNKALQIDSNFVDAYVGRGIAQMESNHVKEGIKDFDQAIQINPHDAEAYAFRSKAKLDMGDEAGSGTDFVHANEAFYQRELSLKQDIHNLKFSSTSAEFAKFVEDYKNAHPDANRIDLVTDYLKTPTYLNAPDDPLNQALKSALNQHLSDPNDSWINNSNSVNAAQDVGWNESFYNACTNGAVNDVWKDADDLIIVGDFTAAGGVKCSGIAKWDGSKWHSIGQLKTNFKATCVAKYNSDLFVGGEGGVCRLAKDGQWVNIPIEGSVRAFLSTEDGLFVAGSFKSIDSIPASNIAVWDGINFHPLGDGVFGDNYSTVNCIALFQGGVLVGGTFGSAGKVEAHSLALWKGGNWTALSVPDQGRIGEVTSIATFNGQLLAAGDFENFPVVSNGSSTLRNLSLMQYDGTNWRPVDLESPSYLSQDGLGQIYKIQTHPKVSAISSDANGWIIALKAVGENPYSVFISPLLWKWDGQRLSPIPALTCDGTVLRILPTGQGLVVAGKDFASASTYVRVSEEVGNGTIYQHQEGQTQVLPIYPEGIMRINNGVIESFGNGLGILDPGGTGTPKIKLAAYGSGFCCASSSSCLTAGAARSGGVIYCDGTGWHPTDPKFQYFGNSGQGVEALASYNGSIVASALFQGPALRNFWGVATYVNGVWTPLGQEMKCSVKAFALFKGQLIATGYFENSDHGNQHFPNIAVLTGNVWSPLGRGLTDGSGLALAATNDKLYVGGDFKHAGGFVAEGVAQWDGNQWSPVGNGLKGTVQSVCVDSKGNLYAAGNFKLSDNSDIVSLAVWNGSQWKALAQAGYWNANKVVAWNGFVIVGGSFSKIGNIQANNIAAFDGSTWRSLGSGCDAEVTDLAVNGSQLMVGGDFSSAGGKPASNVTIFDLTKLSTLSTATTLTPQATGIPAPSSARFWAPSGVAVDVKRNVYVADTTNNTIRKITPDGVVTTLAGSPGQRGSRDGTGSAAQFFDPSGVALDGSGNLYVADSGNNTIRKITPNGTVTTLAGTAGQRGSTDGTGGAASFNVPGDLAVDGNGNLYVTDKNNFIIRKITSAGAVTTLAGSSGTTGSNDGMGSAARFLSPSGVAVDGSGNLYVADSGNSIIRKITPDGAVTTLAGSAHKYGSSDGVGSQAQFFMPSGVAVDGNGNVYVADTTNKTIRKITPDGVVTTVAGSARHRGSSDGTGSQAQFFAPCGVAVDGSGNLYVADKNNNTIRKITQGGVVTTLAGFAGSSGSSDSSAPQ
jgi:tetratricopeptide (TPR) repeat protein/sugar lactone lactonase YvrE